MNKNKLSYYYRLSEEIDKIKESQEYLDLKEFYYFLMNNNMADDIVFQDTFSL